MKYTIKQGSIAAMIHVIDEAGNVTDCIYMSENKQPEAYPSGNYGGNGVAAWEALPLAVRAHVNRQFGAVFALPINRRHDFVEHCVDTILEIPV
jgi:hypothetical protein